MRILREGLTALAWLAFWSGVLLVLGALVRLGTGLADSPRLAHPRLCEDGRVRACLRGHEGRVVSVSPGKGVNVTYDDGRREATFDVRGDARPAARAAVRVEFWGREAVSFTDAHGRRYKDDARWPAGFPGWGFIALGFGGALMLPAALLKGWRIRRSRRR